MDPYSAASQEPSHPHEIAITTGIGEVMFTGMLTCAQEPPHPLFPLLSLSASFMSVAPPVFTLTAAPAQGLW
jgi:hypothetical protein